MLKINFCFVIIVAVFIIGTVVSMPPVYKPNQYYQEQPQRFSPYNQYRGGDQVGPLAFFTDQKHAKLSNENFS
jgi:hypothetical protein